MSIGVISLGEATNDRDLALTRRLEDLFRQVDSSIDSIAKPFVRAVSANYTVSDEDSTILVTGTTTISLLPASRLQGKVYTIKRLDASNATTISADGSETIDGAASYTLTAQYKYVVIQSDGSNWYVIGNN